MTAAYLSGIAASVNVLSVTFRFDKWKLAVKTNLPKVTNFESAGFQEIIKAVTSGTVTLSGPYDTGNMPFTCGTSYVFTLNVSSAVTLTVTALIESLEMDVDTNDAARVNITAQSNGSFSVSIV